MELLILELLNIVDFSILSSFLHFASNFALLLYKFCIEFSQILFHLNLDVIDFLLKLCLILRIYFSSEKSFETLLFVSCLLSDILLLLYLFFHHVEHLFLELECLLLVKLQQQVLKLLLVLIVDDALKCCRYLLWGKVHLHVLHNCIQSILSHLVLGVLVLLRIVNGSLNALLQLLRLHCSLLLKIGILFLASCS